MPWEQPAHLVPNLLERGRKKKPESCEKSESEGKREPGAPAATGCGSGGPFVPISPPQNPTSGARSSSISPHHIRRLATSVPLGRGGRGEPSSLRSSRSLRRVLGFGVSPSRDTHTHMSILDRIWPQKGRRGGDDCEGSPPRSPGGEFRFNWCLLGEEQGASAARRWPENPGE